MSDLCQNLLINFKKKNSARIIQKYWIIHQKTKLYHLLLLKKEVIIDRGGILWQWRTGHGGRFVAVCGCAKIASRPERDRPRIHMHTKEKIQRTWRVCDNCWSMGIFKCLTEGETDDW